MALYKVKKEYRDLEIGRKLKKDEEVEMTVKRANEVARVLKEKGFEGDFLERLNVEDNEEGE